MKQRIEITGQPGVTKGYTRFDVGLLKHMRIFLDQSRRKMSVEQWIEYKKFKRRMARRCTGY